MAKSKKEVAEGTLSGNAYLKELLSLIPEEKKETILTALGEEIMPRADYSRAMDDLRSKEQAVAGYKSQLDGWYAEKLGTLEEYEKLKANPPATPPASGQLASLEGFVKTDEVKKLVSAAIQQSEETSLAVFAPMVKLAAEHLHTYGKPLDPNAVVAHARKNGTNLNDAYLEVTAEDRAARQASLEKAREAKLREEIRAEVLKESGHGIYPVGLDTGASTLSGLKPEGQAKYGIAAAIADFQANAGTRRANG